MRLPPIVDSAYPRGRLAGVVICASSGSPLSQAVVWIDARSDYQLPEASSVSGLDGAFTFDQVPVGEYFVFARKEGYVSAECLNSPPLRWGGSGVLSGSTELLDTLVARVEVKHLETSQILLQLHSPGSITGRAVWEDGSPAAHRMLDVMLIHEDGTRKQHTPEPWNLRKVPYLPTKEAISASAEDWLPGTERSTPAFVMSPYGQTDVDGKFCIDGLYTGSYIVGVQVPRYLKYVRANEYPLRGPETINCFSSYCWTGNQAYYENALAVDVVAGAVSLGIDIVIPMREAE